MANLLLLLIVSIAYALGSRADPPSKINLITSLPGWDGPLPSKMYTGFIPAGVPPGYPTGTMYVHYWFIESERNPTTDPVVLWYNGGPGASSLFGLLVELGPFLLNDESLDNDIYNKTGIPQLIPNPYGWSKTSNLLIVDNPPPVGFSYCDPIGPTGDGTSCGPWNDSYVATTNYNFLFNWLSVFPQYSSNDLYITGESYAGVYVPIIAREILNRPNPIFNLKGFAVGDGCMGTDVLCGDSQTGPYYDIEFFHGHGQFSNELYNNIVDSCPETDLKNGNLTPLCQNLVNQMWTQIGGFYDYNLYDDCIDRNIFQKRVNPNHPSYTSQSPTTGWWDKSFPFSLGQALNDYPCPGSAMMLWLNRTDVREAIAVPVDSYFFSGDNGEGFSYTSTEKNVLPFYEYVIKSTELRVLFYNGDTDPGINSFRSQDILFDFFNSVGIKKINDWRPWTLDGKKRMGGYVTEFEGNFNFLTIRGSGHMVPEYKPPAAAVFYQTWLDKQPFPTYNPN